MAVQVNIDENKIDNFSDGAKTTLEKQIEKYTDDIIKEANLIEEAIREDGASAEITSNIVLQAVRKNKNNHNRKANTSLIIIKIVSAFSLLITGFLFDSTGYQDNILKLVAFVVCLIIASVSTVLQFVFEERSDNVNILPKNDKIEKYLDELADEYKVLLYNALVSRTKPLDDLSVSELLRLDNEIKKPLFEDYQKKQHRRQLFLIAGLIYMFTGVFLYFLQKVIWSDFVYNIKSITSLIAVIITFVGFVITIYSCFFQMFYNKNSRYKIKKEDATKILEYEIIAKWRELDGIVNDISMNLEVKTPRSIIQFLVDNRFIDDEEKDVLRRFLKVRNNIVHSMDNNYTEPELKVMLDDIDKIINKIKKIM